MTLWSVRPGSTQFQFRTPPLRAAWRWLPKHAGRALLRALQESRARAAAKVFRDYADLNADHRDATLYAPHR
jgi:hypothetical protein